MKCDEAGRTWPQVARREGQGGVQDDAWVG